MRRPTGSPRSIRRTVLPALLACATVVLLVAPGGAVARASLGSHAVVPTHALLHRGRSVAGPPRLVPPPASSVPAGNWTNLSKNSTFAPPSRQAFVMAYDPLIGAAVLFGGLDASSNVLGDTWEYVRGNWTPVHSTASPSARLFSGMVYDPTEHGLVLFGGRDGSNRYLNDTWLFNGSGWTNLTGVGPAPSGRGVHDSLAYDAADGYVLLFGGFSASGYHEDTWTFANGTWSNISASLSAAPPGASYRAAYDAISHDAVFYGSAGACTGPAYTWTYSAGTWTNRTPATGGPTASAGAGAIAYDPILGGVLINGGYDTTCTVTDESWLFQNGTWSDISNVSSTTPPGRWDAQMVFDNLLTGDLLFSGNEATHGGSATLGSDTWGFLDGLRVAITANASLGPIPLAVGLSLSGPPGGTGPYTYAWTFGDGALSTYGSAANHTYTTPGSYPVSLEVNDSSGRWGWGFATVTATPPILGSWTNISAGAGTPPTPRAAFGMAYDPLLSAIVVFGGIDTNNVILGDTWEFKDGRWSQPTLAVAPPARVQLAMVYDPQEQGIILFGGRAANYTFYNDTWLFNASGWTHLSPAGPAPSPRSVDGSMTYDAGDGYLLLLGGWSLATGGLTDTWSFANGTWTNRTAHVSTSPPYAAYRGAYDAHDGYAVYFGSPGSCTGPAYTWTYAAGTWTNRTASAGSPTIQAGAGDMDYDPIEGAIVVSGGYDASCYVTNQTYLFTDGAWSDVTGLVGVNPPGRWDAGSAFDGALTGNVVWGGNEELKGGSNNFEGTTWAFEDGLTAAPTASPTEGVAPLTVSFGPGPSLGGTPPYRYNWSFGDGSANATIADPTHTYSSPGSYTVDLVVNDSAGRFGSGAIALTVYAPIGVAVSVTPEAGEAPLTATFGVVATGGVPSLSYTWAFGDGNSSTARNTTHTYTRGGPYNWTLTVVDALGDRNETNGTIDVVPALAVSAAASTQAGSFPLTVNFTGSVTGGAGPFRYAWSFGDGALGPNASAASHTYTATGSFPAAFNVTDADGVTRTATLTIVVVPPVSAGGSATPLVGIAPLTVEFTTVPSGGEAPYEIGWSFGDGSAGSTQSVVTHTYTLDGNYTAVLTVVDKFGDEAQTSFAIESARVLAVGLSATPDRAIAPAPIALAAGVTGGIAPYAYSWTFGDGGSSSTGPEVAHTYSSPGTFAVDVTVTDRTGSVARQTTNVSIAVAESVTVVANTSSSQVGRSVELTAQANGGFPAYTYTWTGLPPGCSPSSTDIDACTPAVSGSFTVRIQVNDSAGDEANGTYLLVVGPAPTSGGGTTSSPGPISPALAIAIFAGVAAVALVLVAVLWMRRRRPPPAPDPWDDAEDVGPSG